MQAEHIPVHLGAMPAAVEAVRGRGARARASPGCSTTPTAAARTCPTSPSSRRRSPTDGELLGFAANRAHHADVGGPTPGLDARRLDHARRRGRRDRAAPRSTTAAIDELVAQMRQPAQRRADLRAQLAANRDGRRAAAGARTRRADLAGGDGGDDRLRRAAHARLPRRAAGRHAPRRGRARGARGRPRARARGDRRAATSSRSTSPARPPSTAATSTARSPSRARPAGSPCACSPTPTSRPPPAPTGRSR